MRMNLFCLLNKHNNFILKNIPVKRKIVLIGGQCIKKSKNKIDSQNNPYQEYDTLTPVLQKLTDDIGSVRHENGEQEIYDVQNETT